MFDGGRETELEPNNTFFNVLHSRGWVNYMIRVLACLLPKITCSGCSISSELPTLR